MTALCLGMQQCELGALYIEGLTGDYRKARIMVILFAEPRWKIRPGWRIYFSAMNLMGGAGQGGALQKFTDCGAEVCPFGSTPGWHGQIPG